MIHLFSVIGDKRVPLTYTSPDSDRARKRQRDRQLRKEQREKDRLAVELLSSQCGSVSVAAPIIVVCYKDDCIQTTLGLLKRAGYQKVTIEYVERPAPPPPPEVSFCNHGAWI